MEENKKQKSKKWLLIIVGMVIAATVIILLLLRVGGKIGGNRDKVSVTAKTEDTLSADIRSLLMKSGESRQITASKKGAVFASSNPEVATVDKTGKVTALKKGNALITITAEERTAYCGVLVDSVGSMVDVSKQKAKTIFSDVILEEPGAIKGFAVDKEHSAYYLSQPYATDSYVGLPSDVVVSKVVKNSRGTWESAEWMRFYESGTGTIALNKKGSDSYLMLESNGTYFGSGQALSNVAWKNETYAQGEYGETLTLEGVKGSASPAIDKENDLLVIYDNVKKSYLIYDQKTLQDGAVYLHEVVCEKNQEPVAGVDDSQGFYNASIRDFAVADGYIYQISGSASIYISVFDLNGTLQYCHRVLDYDDMEVRTPGGIDYVDGSIYIAVGSGNKQYYFGNVWIFQ